MKVTYARVTAWIAIGLGAFFIFALSVDVMFYRGREVADFFFRCDGNLAQLARSATTYATETHGERFPPLSRKPGRLMWAAEVFDDSSRPPGRSYVCHEDHSSSWTLEGLYDRLGDDLDPGLYEDDWSYFYLGYLVQDDEDIAFFAEAYRERLASGLPFEDIPRPNTGDKYKSLLVLRLKIERFLIADINAPDASTDALSRIPLLIEKPWNHDKPGGHVAYLDGHVEWIDFPGKWPMTRKTMRILRELDALSTPVPEKSP